MKLTLPLTSGIYWGSPGGTRVGHKLREALNRHWLLKDTLNDIISCVKVQNLNMLLENLGWPPGFQYPTFTVSLLQTLSTECYGASTMGQVLITDDVL